MTPDLQTNWCAILGYVSPSASSLVVGFWVVRCTSRNLLAAEMAQVAALLMDGDGIGGHRHGTSAETSRLGRQLPN
jgi:hypothetical protein